MQDDQKMPWKKFILTSHFFPGQTLYHDVVLFEKKNSKEVIFFIGDSFTPFGIDDYCLLNRNLLHPGTGYFYCLDILKKLYANVLLANQHVETLFVFFRQQLDYMTNLLLERNAILKDLFPWDDVNYGVDEQLIKVYPYGQKASPARLTSTGTILVARMDMGKVCEYDANGKELLSIEAPGVWSAEPLKNGNILITGKNIVRELNRKMNYLAAELSRYHLEVSFLIRSRASGN